MGERSNLILPSPEAKESGLFKIHTLLELITLRHCKNTLGKMQLLCLYVSSEVCNAKGMLIKPLRFHYLELNIFDSDSIFMYTLVLECSRYLEEEII